LATEYIITSTKNIKPQQDRQETATNGIYKKNYHNSIKIIRWSKHWTVSEEL